MLQINPNVVLVRQCANLPNTTTLNAATFMGKNCSTMQNVVQNEESLTLKQMFDVTAQMIHNEEEIYCLDKILYQKNSWSLINDPVIINLQSTKV